jgi:DNA polymerase-3 subunit delta
MLAHVASAELEPVYLITGTDLPKISLALRRLRARFAEGSIVHLDAGSASGEEAVSATNALGLFGGGERLVLVDGIERWKKADAEAVARYLESPTPGSVLALAGDPSRLPGLEAACKAAGAVLRYDIPTRRRGRQEIPDYVPWVRAEFERAGIRVDPETAERLVELIGEDALALQTEVDKISAWSAGETVGAGEVEALASPMHETSIFALADAWGKRDAAGALAACEARLLKGDEPFKIAVRLADYVGRVRAVQALLEEDVELRTIGERLGLRFPPRREAGHAANYSGEELADALVRLAELDLALKGGSRLDPELELERALLDVTRPGGHRGGPAV